MSPGMRRIEYIVNENMRRGRELNEEDAPKMVRIGVQLPNGLPKAEGLDHSQIPIPAMSDRWMEPSERTGAPKRQREMNRGYLMRSLNQMRSTAANAR